MTLHDFCLQHGITARTEPATTNPNMDDMPWGSKHYRVQLRHGRKRMTVPYSQGPAITTGPTAADVLYCLLSDASTYDGAINFAGWCDELGYDTDSRKAERTYRTVKRQTEKLRAFLGELYDAGELQDAAREH